MINSVTIAGRAGGDPEMEWFEPSGGRTEATCKATVSIAMTNPFRKQKDENGNVVKDDQGRERLDSDWVDVQCWGKTAELLGEHIKKGDPVGFTGRLEQQKWKTEGGEKRSRLVVLAEKMHFLPKGGSGGGNSGGDRGYSSREEAERAAASRGGDAPAPEGRSIGDAQPPKNRAF